MNSNKNWREDLYVMIFQSDTKAGRRFDGSLLLIANAGAYGRSMASSYNLRDPPEELILA